MFGGNFAPAGWMLCVGQLLPISENETLFNLIGTTYGGDRQQPAARQHAAVPRDQLHHLPVRDFPVTELTWRGAARRLNSEYSHDQPIRRRDPPLRLQFPAQGLGLVRRAAHADLAEY